MSARFFWQKGERMFTDFPSATRRKKSWSLPMLLITLGAGSSSAWALPSPVDHVHRVDTVFWKEPGSPALPWSNATANSWNHNHLTADPFSNGAIWQINKAWDNHTLHSVLLGQPQFGHGLIETGDEVRFFMDASVPALAQPNIVNDYALWVTRAQIQFFSNATDLSKQFLALGFTNVTSGPTDITIKFTNNLAAGYGVFNSGTKIMEFEANPKITVATAGGLKRISVGNPGNGDPGSTALDFNTPWSYSGTPGIDANYDLWYSDDGGATWTNTAPGGFGLLNWNFGTLAASDTLDVYKMDFDTIALHEIGHSIALGHTGPGSGNIMDDNIAQYAHFGSTLGIDEASALAVAIDYTYAIPEPATLSILGLASVSLLMRRRR
jgi:hypothetical protein